MSAQTNIQIVRRFIEECLNQGDLLAMDQLIAPDFAEYGNISGTKLGIESLKENIVRFRAAVPSYHATIEAIRAEDDRVIVSTKSTGKVVASFPGLDTRLIGKHVIWSETRNFGTTGGRITDFYVFGQIPSPIVLSSPGVQILVSAGIRLISQIIYRSLYQAIAIVLILAATLAVLQNDTSLATRVNVTGESAIQFFSALSQATAALLGLLFAFLIFRIQVLDQERVDDYRELKSEVRALIQLVLNRPAILEQCGDDLGEIIRQLAYLPMRQLPISRRDWEKVNTRRKKWRKFQEQAPLADRLALEEMVLILNNLREINGRLGNQYVDVQLTGFTITAIAKLSMFLGVSLILIPLVSASSNLSNNPDILRTSITLSMVAWLVIVLLELVARFRGVYGVFRETRKIPD